MLVALLGAVAATAGAQNPPPARDDTKPAELPAGEGRTVLERACTTCHDLGEVTKFSAFYTKDDWRDVVVTMVKYGAELREGEAAVLVEYLGQHFSRK